MTTSQSEFTQSNAQAAIEALERRRVQNRRAQRKRRQRRAELERDRQQGLEEGQKTQRNKQDITTPSPDSSCKNCGMRNSNDWDQNSHRTEAPSSPLSMASSRNETLLGTISGEGCATPLFSKFNPKVQQEVPTHKTPQLTPTGQKPDAFEPVLDSPFAVCLDPSHIFDMDTSFAPEFHLNSEHPLEVCTTTQMENKQTIQSTAVVSCSQSSNTLGYMTDMPMTPLQSPLLVLDTSSVPESTSPDIQMETLRDSSNSPLTPKAAGMTALHIGSELGNVRVVQFLLSRGVDVDGIDAHGQTALHLAAGAGHLNVVTQLLACGADPESRDFHGLSPLHVAAAAGSEAIIELLAQNGVDLNSEVGKRDGFNGERRSSE